MHSAVECPDVGAGKLEEKKWEILCLVPQSGQRREEVQASAFSAREPRKPDPPTFDEASFA